jgi:hypothetical protein
MLKVFALVLPVLLVASCGLTDVEQPETIGFAGSFEPDSPEMVISGGVAALTQFGNTEISVSAEGLEPESVVPWLMRLGVCDGEGEPVIDPAALPPLETDEAGRASIDPPLPVGGELDGEAEYAVELFDGSLEEGDRLACADLERTI